MSLSVFKIVNDNYEGTFFNKLVCAKDREEAHAVANIELFDNLHWVYEIDGVFATGAPRILINNQ